MAIGVNKVVLIGNLGRDPEIKSFEGGGMLARFTLATTESYLSRKTNERVEQTEWHTVILHKGLAEVAEKYLHKGDKIYVEGRIKTRSWEDQSGEKKYATEIHAREMIMLGSPSGDSSHSGGQSSNSNTGQSAPVDLSPDDNEDDDLPF